MRRSYALRTRPAIPPRKKCGERNSPPDAETVGSIDTAGFSPSVFSAQLARAIYERYDGAFDALYVSTECLPQVGLALRKLKHPEQTPVIGYGAGGGCS